MPRVFFIRTFAESYSWRICAVPGTIKSSWHHPSQSPLVRSAFQGLADHPIGLSTAPAPAQSVHCASARHIYICARCTHARTECAGGFTDTRRCIYCTHTPIQIHINTHALACDAETRSRAIVDGRGAPRAVGVPATRVKPTASHSVTHFNRARVFMWKEMIARLHADRCTLSYVNVTRERNGSVLNSNAYECPPFISCSSSSSSPLRRLLR